jgi:hypothetical protein
VSCFDQLNVKGLSARRSIGSTITLVPIDPRKEIADVLIGETNAAGRNMGADTRRLIGAVDPVHGAGQKQ